jgi:hypothetical protein
MYDHAKAALARNFSIFALQPRSKYPLPGSHAHLDAKNAADPTALDPWKRNPNYNIGIATGQSGLIVVDIDDVRNIPGPVQDAKTYKVSTARPGLHAYFTGNRPSGKLVIGGQIVGDIKSNGAFVLAAGSVHPSGKRYEVLDDSPVTPMTDAVAALLNEPSAAVKPVSASRSDDPIPYGAHYDTLFRIAAAYRGKGLDREHIELLLAYDCETRCVEYGDDYKQMCGDIAASVMRYQPNAQGGGACGVGGSSPPKIACSRCYEPQEWSQTKFHRIVYRPGIVEQPLCLYCHEEIKAMNFAMLNWKPTTGKLIDQERWVVWQAFLTIPKRSFLNAATDVQERYVRLLCDNLYTLGELASNLMAG